MSEQKKNKKILLTALILMIGVSLIPLIYSTTYIASVWDVYGNTDKLPIAVVNEDKGAEYDGKSVNFGEDVSEALKENTQMKWVFTDAESAKKGLEEDNAYYAVITIPQDFSKDLTSAASQTKTQATIRYSANEKRNYTASLMLRSAMLSLKDKVKSKEAGKITEKLVAELNEVPDSLEKITDATGKLEDGSTALGEGLDELSKGNETITENLNTFTSGLSDAKKGTQQLKEGTDKFPELIAGAESLSEGADLLSANAPKITEGIKQVSDGVNALQSGVSSGIVQGKQTLNSELGSSVFAGVNQAIDMTMQELSPAVTQGVERAAGEMSAAIDDAIVKTADTLNPAVDQAIEKTVQTLSPTIDQAVAQTSQTINSSVDQGVRLATDKALGEESDAAKGIKNYTSGVEAYLQGSENYINFPSNVNDYTAGVEAYINGTDNLIALINAGDMQTAQAVAAGLSQAGKSLSESTLALKTGAERLTQNSDTLRQGADNLRNGSESINSLSLQVKEALDTQLSSALKSGISEGLTENFAPALKDGISSGLSGSLAPALKEGISGGLSAQLAPALKSGISEGLVSGLAPQLVSGIEDGLKNDMAPQLSQGLTDGIRAKVTESLDDMDSKIRDGVSAIQTGLLGVNGSGKLSDGASPALLAGSVQLSEGTAQLSEGAATLSSGAGQLTLLADGAKELNTGLERLADGAPRLADGSVRLGEGITSAADGNRQIGDGIAQLDDSVTDAAQSAREKLKVTDGLAEHVEDDVDIDSEPFDHVPNYGTSFAPYFFNVSLWTGGLISLITIYYDHKRRLTWLGPKSTKPMLRFLTFAGLAAVQGILCGLAAQFGLGLAVNNPFLYYAGLIAIGVTFTLIIECLMLNFGDIGKMVSMIIMVLQLTATGGTFPTELNPPFFQAINHVLPMTYGIQMMKEAISGNNPAYWSRNFGMLMAFAAAAMAGIIIGKLIRRHNSQTIRHEHIILEESHA